jgi:hypothetical protein
LAVKPNDVVALGASEPFQLAFVTVTLAPLALSVPFHSWVMTSPLLNVHVTRQPEMATDPVFRTVTEAWKPPGHEFVTR